MGLRALFLGLLAFRLFNSLTIETFFQPDEYYQSLEPAHVLVFGYGFMPWEFRHAIRGANHTILFAIPFAILKILGLDHPSAIVVVPKIIGAVQAALADWYTIRFVRKQWPATRDWCVLITVLSPWNYYAATRTFSNSLETAFTAGALFYWPFVDDELKSDEQFQAYVLQLIKSFSFIGLATLLRPTTVLFWVVPSIVQLRRRTWTFAFEAALAAWVVLMYNVIVDSFFYGKLTLSAWNFFKFNLTGNASFYGVNQWHYYLSQGVPMLLMSLLPLALIGALLKRGAPHRQQFLGMTGLTIGAYSLLAHKEARFVQPLQPILLGFASAGLHWAWARRSRAHILVKMIITIVLLALAGLSVVLCHAGARVHQRGVVDFINHVRDNPTPFQEDGLLMLMPCHSTPWQANIHRGPHLSHMMRFLTCEPPVTQTFASEAARLAYRDEADRFYDAFPLYGTTAPAGADGEARENLSWVDVLGLETAPGYVATFESTAERVVAGAPPQFEYVLVERWFNSKWHDDWRRRGDVVLLQRRDKIEEVSTDEL